MKSKTNTELHFLVQTATLRDYCRKNTNEKQSKTATDGQQSDFRMNFLGAAQLSDSTDSDSDTPKGLAMNVTCNDNLDSDSDFFG